MQQRIGLYNNKQLLENYCPQPPQKITAAVEHSCVERRSSFLVEFGWTRCACHFDEPFCFTGKNTVDERNPANHLGRVKPEL